MVSKKKKKPVNRAWYNTPGLREFIGACEEGWNDAKKDLKKYKTIRECYNQCNDWNLLNWAFTDECNDKAGRAFTAVDSALAFIETKSEDVEAARCIGYRNAVPFDENTLMQSILKEFPKLKG